MTINDISKWKDIQPASVKKTIRRAYQTGRIAHLPRLDETVPLPDEIVKLFPLNGAKVSEKPVVASTPDTAKHYSQPDPAPKSAKKKSVQESGWFRIFGALPLAMLGISASYGVFHFAGNFVPGIIAVIEAMAFEATYIRLGLIHSLSDHGKTLATKVSVGAVVVSVIYNTIGGAMYLYPDIMSGLKPTGAGVWSWLFWSVCILHGLPLAVLAYNVSKLQIDQQ